MYVGYNPHLGYEDDVLRENERMVRSVANKFYGSLNSGFDYEDLMSVGTIGLIEAFRNYDPDRFDGKVTSFATYAFPMIKWSIQRYLRDKRHLVRIPRSIQDKLAIIRKQGWEQETAESIAELSGWSIAISRMAKQVLEGWSVSSLDQTVTHDSGEDGGTLLDLLPSAEDFTSVYVQEFISCLTSTEQTIIQLRMVGVSQSNIAKEIGVTQAHVSRILARIGDKYIKFQSGELKKGAVRMSKVREKTDKAVYKNIVEWFIDEGVPTNPTIGLNAHGIHFNRRAVHEIGCKAGQCLQVGYDATGNRLLIRVDNNGLQLRKLSGDVNGALRLVNKRLAAWLKQKKLPLKRYTLHHDQGAGIYYILFDRHAA